MASEERRQTNEIIAQQNLFKTLAAGEPEAETDAFQCGRCKQVSLDQFLRYITVD
jgi:transcription elongation factor S-II